LLVLRLLRVHHWAKNFLVFVPVVMGHQLGDQAKMNAASILFFSFCFASSAGYILNDWFDREHDRVHRSKQGRPISAGEVGTGMAIVTVVILVVLALFSAWSLGLGVLAGVLLYMVLTTLYTVVFKRVVIADVILLTSFYSLRVLVGGAATDIEVSRWLLAFSSFLFFSLALVKRYADLMRAAALGEVEPAGRGYLMSDRDLLRSFGVASGCISVLVFALYLNSEQVTMLYTNTDPLWGICALLLYWVGRIWLLAHRGAVDDDPIVFAAQDPASYAVAAAAAVILVFAT
jgi:4-hydroxybenzoate polyprenyltransferase